MGSTIFTDSELLDNLVEGMIVYDEDGNPFIWFGQLHNYDGLSVEDMLSGNTNPPGPTPPGPTPQDYSTQYFTTEALENGSIVFNIAEIVPSSLFRSISYSTDNGATWTTVTNDESGTEISVNVSQGDKVLWKADADTVYYYDEGTDEDYFCNFAKTTTRFDVYGNIMSLLYGDNFQSQTELTYDDWGGLTGLFGDYIIDAGSNVVNAEHLILPATTLSSGCYNSMFYSCTNLITAPALPATTLAESCYGFMFSNCTSLTTAPLLPALTLEAMCYQSMFDQCTSLNYIKCLATDISANSCTENWLRSVSPTGTFIKAANMTDWTTGPDGIPTGWTVEDDGGGGDEPAMA